MSTLLSFLSEATCGEACWSAREDVCHCSCGGKNHGCLRSADGVQPTRNCKIDGDRYELKAVGGEVHADAKAINLASGIKSCLPSMLLGEYYGAATSRDRMFKCLPAKIRQATKAQIEKWPELKSERERVAALPANEWRGREIYLLWVKV